MPNLSDAAATAQAEASGEPIVSKLLQAREQLDYALGTATTYAIAKRNNHSKAFKDTAVTEVLSHLEACHKLTDAAMEDLMHKQDFEDTHTGNQ